MVDYVWMNGKKFSPDQIIRPSDNEIVNRLYNLAKICMEKSKFLSKEYSAKCDQPPLSGLNMVHNYLILACEIIPYYCHKPQNLENECLAKEQIEKNKDENTQRIARVLVNSLISIMSSLEYTSKIYLKITKKINFSNRQRVYFLKIMEESCKKNIICKNDLDFWDFVIKMRNSIVHNNAILEKSISCQISSDCEIYFSEGVMMTTSFKNFVTILENIVKRYVMWCKNVISVT